MKILVLGFSVLNGLIEKYSGPRDGHCFSIRALGGNHFLLYSYLIDMILNQEMPDRVVLDLVSTPRSAHWTRDQFHSIVEFIVACCHERGATVGFINLFRNEIDENKDMLHDVVNCVARHYNAPSESAQRWHRQRGHNLERAYPDGNHPSVDGRALLSSFIDDLIEKIPDRQPVCAMPAAFLVRRPVCLIPPDANEPYDRYGLKQLCRLIPGGTSHEISLPEGFVLRGALVVMGPVTGEMTFRYGEHTDTVMAYDKFCYYVRARHYSFKPTEAGRITIEQSAAHPPITLSKGEADMSPRVGGVLAILGTMPITGPQPLA